MGWLNHILQPMNFRNLMVYREITKCYHVKCFKNRFSIEIEIMVFKIQVCLFFIFSPIYILQCRWKFVLSGKLQ